MQIACANPMQVGSPRSGYRLKISNEKSVEGGAFKIFVLFYNNLGESIGSRCLERELLNIPSETS